MLQSKWERLTTSTENKPHRKTCCSTTVTGNMHAFDKRNKAYFHRVLKILQPVTVSTK